MTMSDLQVGQRIKDNDPRTGTRILTIVEVLPNGVVARGAVGTRTSTILRRRIFTDGKPRRYGFNVIAANIETGKPGDNITPHADG